MLSRRASTSHVKIVTEIAIKFTFNSTQHYLCTSSYMSMNMKHPAAAARRDKNCNKRSYALIISYLKPIIELRRFNFTIKCRCAWLYNLIRITSFTSIIFRVRHKWVIPLRLQTSINSHVYHPTLNKLKLHKKRLITFDNLIVLFNIKTLLLSETRFQLIYFLLKKLTSLPFLWFCE